MTKKKTRTKQEHYIPNKSYLDYFVDEKLKPKALWVYFNKKEVFIAADKATYKNITPANLCKESYLYETPRLPVNAIEKVLQTIENNYKKVLDSKIIPQKKLTVDDKMAVAQFISTLEMRTPLNKQSSDKFISDVKEQVIHLEQQFAQGRQSKLHKELNDAEKQNLMFTRMLITATQMNRYQVTDMLFLSPEFDDEESYFITSDFPVSMVDFCLMNSFYPPTPLDATVEVTIPLTPKIALLINHLGLNGYKDIDYNFVWEINNRTLKRSNKFIISPKRFSERFTRLNINRYPQSFIVLFLSDYIRDKRAKRTDNYMRKTVTKIIKSVKDSPLFSKIVDCVYIQPYDKKEFGWFGRALDLMGKKGKDTEKYVLYELNKTISVGLKKISKVKIIRIITTDQSKSSPKE